MTSVIVRMILLTQLYWMAETLISYVGAEGAVVTALSTAKPGCPTKCGDLVIPFPFGIGNDCSLGEDFNISCLRSNAEALPVTKLSFNYLTISNFSLSNGEIQAMHRVAYYCQYSNEVGIGVSIKLKLRSSYNLSTRNKFFTIGCNVIGYYQFENQTYGMTMPICYHFLGNMSKFCNGFGCSTVSIPLGLREITSVLFIPPNATDPWRAQYPCSYAFVTNNHNFVVDHSPRLQHRWGLTRESTLPILINWAVGKHPCDEAPHSCKSNALCVNRNTITRRMSGYICHCKPGYQGNPYIGCTDIDECTTVPPICEHGRCENSAGNYSCVCNQGFVNLDSWTCILDNTSNNLLLKVLLGTGGGLGSAVLIFCTWWLTKFWKKRKTIRRKKKFFEQNGGLLLKQKLSSAEDNIERIKMYDSKELEKATCHFSADRIVGQGGQGTVYKGMLADGTIVAIKKSKIVGGREVEQFINEISLLSQINHRNVVKLFGCCLETQVPLLVYEFIPKGTIYQHLHEDKENFPLTWEMRLRISVEVARALSHLHSTVRCPIYHRDIKSTNILLDDKYIAKVADFGTSRAVSINQTHLSTLVQGTFGYLDPEYFLSGQFTEKSDVYSFGVVLVELLTGEKPVFSTGAPEASSLVAYFNLSLEENKLFEIIDARVKVDGVAEDILTIANIAKKCLNMKGTGRPTMKEIERELEVTYQSVKYSKKSALDCGIASSSQMFN